MVSGTITTGPDELSSTILFKSEDTPSNAYEHLTDAVLAARFTPGWIQIDIEKLPPQTTIGVATYDEDAGEVTALNIRQDILDDYGHKQ